MRRSPYGILEASGLPRHADEYAAFLRRLGEEVSRVGGVELAEVARLAMGLPETTETERWGNRTWAVAGKAFAWERPFSKADIKRYGDQPPPAGPILAVRVADLAEKEAVLASNTRSFFTIPHFDGYAAVLIQLEKATTKAVREALLDGWLACAPSRLADAYLSQG